jgi:RNase adapter protein RapZ
MLLISFGAKFGNVKKSDFDLIFNLQKLPNPEDISMKNKTGKSKDLQKSFFSLEVVEEKYNSIKQEIENSLKENPNLRVAIGCFAGKHRSVAFVERLTSELKMEGEVYHRDLNKSSTEIKNKKKEKSKKFISFEE